MNAAPAVPGFVGVTDIVQKSQSQVACLNMKKN